jgi:uncharacterized iron-regulated protein
MALSLLVSAHAAEACKVRQGPFLKELSFVTKGCGHSLCGKIYPTTPAASTNTAPSCADEPWARFSADVASALSSHGAVLLGEAHDDPAHHRLQAAMVKEFANKGEKGAGIVFEQIREDQQPGLDRFIDLARSDARKGTVASLKRLIDWDKSGWPKAIYDPLFKSVISAKLAIYPGNVSREAIMKTAKEGESSLSDGERQRLALDRPLDTELDAASLKEIEEAHCGAIPKSAFGGMAYAQRYRDASLADALLKASNRHGGAVLIAGTTHVRTDRGVPWYIHRREPQKKVVSVTFVEVEDGNADAQSYVPRDPDGRPATDYLVFTAAIARGDPCAKMRAK